MSIDILLCTRVTHASSALQPFFLLACRDDHRTFYLFETSSFSLLSGANNSNCRPPAAFNFLTIDIFNDLTLFYFNLFSYFLFIFLVNGVIAASHESYVFKRPEHDLFFCISSHPLVLSFHLYFFAIRCWYFWTATCNRTFTGSALDNDISMYYNIALLVL